jgi:hypothetical protein
MHAGSPRCMQFSGDAKVLKSNPSAVSPIVTINGKEVVSHLEGIPGS